MSVYSGFATRQQETYYNQSAEKLIYLLQKKIIWYDKKGSLLKTCGNHILFKFHRGS